MFKITATFDGTFLVHPYTGWKSDVWDFYKDGREFMQSEDYYDINCNPESFNSDDIISKRKDEKILFISGIYRFGCAEKAMLKKIGLVICISDDEHHNEWNCEGAYVVVEGASIIDIANDIEPFSIDVIRQEFVEEAVGIADERCHEKASFPYAYLEYLRSGKKGEASFREWLQTYEYRYNNDDDYDLLDCYDSNYYGDDKNEQALRNFIYERVVDIEQFDEECPPREKYWYWLDYSEMCDFYYTGRDSYYDRLCAEAELEGLEIRKSVSVGINQSH
jgi:hypothetical protein